MSESFFSLSKLLFFLTLNLIMLMSWFHSWEYPFNTYKTKKNAFKY